MLDTDDTIIALSSPSGRAGRAIIRLSGPTAIALAEETFHPTSPNSQAASIVRRWRTVDGYLNFNCAALPCNDHHQPSPLRIPVTMLIMPAPHSYTRQDVVEMHLPGSPPLVERVLAEMVSRGARAAAPGEFTLRAFLSGRLDLAQAEAVMAVINAAGSRSLSAAQRMLRGALSAPVENIIGKLNSLLAEVELAIDFSTENLPTPGGNVLRQRALAIRNEVVALGRKSGNLQAEPHDLRAVLIGRPNVGKSSLFNRLAASTAERAIVSKTAGTTRDELRASISLGDVALQLSDTAGLDEAVESLRQPAPPSAAVAAATDRLHAAGQSRTTAALQRAELLLVVAESPRLAADASAADDIARLAASLAAPMVLVINKCDVALPGMSADETSCRAAAAMADGMLRFSLRRDSDNPPLSSDETAGEAAEPEQFAAAPPVVMTSALTGDGIDELRRAIMAAVRAGAVDRSSEAVSVSARHRACLDQAAAALERAAEIAWRSSDATPASSPDEDDQVRHELVALELREASDFLGEITGQSGGQTLLEQIFSRFCIGK